MNLVGYIIFLNVLFAFIPLLFYKYIFRYINYVSSIMHVLSFALSDLDS